MKTIIYIPFNYPQQICLNSTFLLAKVPVNENINETSTKANKQSRNKNVTQALLNSQYAKPKLLL